MKRILETFKRKWSEYLLEVFVITFGILLAFGLNSWNEQQKDGKKEREILINIKKNCQTNIKLIREDLEWHRGSMHSSKIVLDVIKNKEPFFDSLSYHFHYAPIFPDHNLSFTAYETLKSTGFDIIRNSDLKNEIIDLFELTYTGMITSLNLVENQTVTTQLPFYLENFERDSTAIPNNYDDLIVNQMFKNILIFTRSIHAWGMELKEPCLKESERIIKMIDEELNK